MTTKTIENVNHLLIQANLPPVTNKRVDMWNALPAILWDKKLSQDINCERVQVLLKAGIFTELDVLNECNTRVESMPLTYEDCPLVKILAPLERDGTLYLSGSETIYKLSWDLYLDYIKNIILLGGRVDHDGLLYWAFDGRGEFELFNYLMDNFDIQPETINFVAGMLVRQMDGSRGNASTLERAAFEQLIEKGIDINLPFYDDDDYHSFLGVVFCYDPDLFEQYLLQKPSQHIIAALPWEFAIGNEYFHTKQLQLVQKLIELGYQLPLDEIIELLEEEELDDYAKALAH
ncbi:MAG: hypothetical protein HRU48_01870 [Vibrio sp.]|uniref:hypothetical protein n=1 Tax=Vibrio TaxID=662 RepID=UPI001EB33ACB|nr:hypothetical protein [Vibrio sp.]NRB66107.1 hypothetical protein [Vibrio sp.]